MCLGSHKDTMVACCPNLEILDHLRNSIVKGSSNDLFKPISTRTTIQDWHGSDNRIKLFNYILNYPDLNLQFDYSEWDEFYSNSVKGELESKDLTINFDKLLGKTYKDIFDNLLSIIAKTRNCESKNEMRFYEVWTLDFSSSCKNLS